MIISIVLVTSCTSVEIQQNKSIAPGQIFVEKFTGPAGGIVTNALEMEFHKKGLLATQSQAKYILTGSANFPGWTDGIAFRLKDKNDILYLRGNATSGGFLTPNAAGKDVAKKICKKLKKDY